MNLVEQQERFWALATRAPGARPAEECFVGNGALSAPQRLDIYADMFLWRQIDSLREDFPKVAALLGDHGSYHAFEDYLAACPSTHPSLNRLGHGLAAFLEAHARADLADLALLEWTRNEVFDEADSAAASATLLEGREDAAAVRFSFAPALRLVDLGHDVVPLWKALDEGQEAPPPAPCASAVAVWRKEFVVYHCALAADEAEALRRALGGATLGEICDAFAAHEDAVPRALQAVASWFAEQWIAGELK
jgi:hypothetical protein